MIENSFGVIPFKKQNDISYVFLIQHRNGGHWGFPKGHKEFDETPELTAARELKEETNLLLKTFLKEEPFIETYDCLKNGTKIHKTVAYFLAQVEGEVVLDSQEILKGDWFSINEAFKKLTFPEGKKLFKEVQEYIKVNT